MTNFEKVKNMGMDELAEKLGELTDCDHCPIRKFCDEDRKTPYVNCKSVWKKWLKSEVESIMKDIKFYLDGKEISFEELSELPQMTTDRENHIITDITLHYIGKDAIYFYTKKEHYTAADDAEQECYMEECCEDTEDEIKNRTLVESPCTEEELSRKLIDIEIQNMIRSLSVPGDYYSLRDPKR